MKILFVRHGQSEDDIINAYGGWSDFPLTKEGEEQIKQSAIKIKALGINFEKIISSPLIRAQSTSKIIAEVLNLSIEISPFLKERNTYGILSGMKKEEAKEKYSEYVSALDNDEYVLGSERIEDTKARANEAMKRILLEKVENIIVVTHGNLLKTLFPLFLNKKLVKKEDGGMILIESVNDINKVLAYDGIEVE